MQPEEMIARLVAFDTTSRNSNLALIEFVRDYLTGYGVQSDLVFDETGNKANLHAIIGPAVDNGVVLSGHSDVVPVDGQDWHSDPFRVEERDGRLYGRGTADMKSFSAIFLALVPEFTQLPLKAPMHLALSYDEEVGCLGAGGLIRLLDSLPMRPKAVIVGEPTEMKVVNAQKGVAAFETIITGLEAHSSATHLGVNAIFFAADLVQFLRQLAAEFEARDYADQRCAPAYTTVHVGTIHGGTALNIIPKQAKLHWECRSLVPDHIVEVQARVAEYVERELRPRLKAASPQADVETRTGANVPPLVVEPDSPAESLVLALANSNHTEAVAYATEGGMFQAAGIPTVICGPGNIREAHKPNEYIALSQVEACVRFLRRLAEHLTTV